MAQGGRSALELWRDRHRDVLILRSGCHSIDALLNGGFRSGMLTEVCGEASAGKTQLCLQLLLQCNLPVQLGGLASAACYISTEGVSGIKRLQELGKVYDQRYGSGSRKRPREDAESAGTSASASSARSFLDGIFIEQVYEADELVSAMHARIPTLLAQHNVKLVVIDSIAAVFRLESTGSVKDASERSRLMFHLANCMRILSAQFQVVFVMTNQVTGNFDEASSIVGSTSSSSSAFKPALGLSWANCINQRLMISRAPEPAERHIAVIMSPYLPRHTARFCITHEGIA